MATGDEHGFFWNSVSGDRLYDASSFELWLKKFFTSGVFDGELGVSSSGGMIISVDGGYANVDGKVKMFDTETFTIATASSSYPRIDTVVVRRSDSNRTISLAVVTGQYSGQNPQPTAPVRTSSMYELVLAQIIVNAGATRITAENIIDKRSDSDVCGIVRGTVQEIDTSQIFDQYQAAWDYWFNNVKDELSEDAAGHLQGEIDDINDALDNVQSMLTFDSTPTSGSTNPVTSDGIYDAIPKISMGTAAPVGGSDGDIYFQYAE